LVLPELLDLLVRLDLPAPWALPELLVLSVRPVLLDL